jgi:hypothetical protein
MQDRTEPNASTTESCAYTSHGIAPVWGQQSQKHCRNTTHQSRHNWNCVPAAATRASGTCMRRFELLLCSAESAASSRHQCTCCWWAARYALVAEQGRKCTSGGQEHAPSHSNSLAYNSTQPPRPAYAPAEVYAVPRNAYKCICRAVLWHLSTAAKQHASSRGRRWYMHAVASCN